MVAGKSPETLPSGWSEYVKVIKGRKVKHYVDPVGGYVFFSKPDAMRYVETGDIRRCLKRPKRRHSLLETNNEFHKIEESSDNEVSHSEKPTNSEDEEASIKQICGGEEASIKKVSEGEEASVKEISDGTCKQPSNNVSSVSVEGNLVDEIPPGWVTEIKTRVHAYGIRRYSHYVDPVSGYVFQSKKDVMRYVQSGDIEKCAVRPKKRDSVSGTYNQSHEIKESFGNEVSQNEKPTNTDGEEASVKQISDGMGDQPSNIVSSHEIKESSGDGVSQNEKPTNSEGEEASVKQVSDGTGERHPNIVSSVSLEGNLVDGIPPGWVKEIKTTRRAYRVRRDAHYVDPVSGYVFSSKKDVMRYVETGDISKCVKRPQKRDIVSVTNNKSASLFSASSPDKKTGQNDSPDGDGEVGVTVSGNDAVSESNLTKSKKKICLSTPSKFSKRLAGHNPEEVTDLSLIGERALRLATRNRVGTETTNISSAQTPNSPTSDIHNVGNSVQVEVNSSAVPDSQELRCVTSSSVAMTKEAEPEAENRNPRSRYGGAKTNGAKLEAQNQNPRSSSGGAKTNEAEREAENWNLRSSSSVAKTNEAKLEAENRKPRSSSSVANTNEAKPETENRNPRSSSTVAKTDEAESKAESRNPRSSPSVPRTNEAKPKADNRNPRSCSIVAKTNEAKPEADPRSHSSVAKTNEAKPEAENGNSRMSSSVAKTNEAKPEAESQKPKMEDSGPRFPFGDCWSDPCFEFAFKILTGTNEAEPETEIRNSRLSSSVAKTNKAEPEAESQNPKLEDSGPGFPFGDCWPDPCLEFAFKTLTGAIPVEDFLQPCGPHLERNPPAPSSGCLGPPPFNNDMTSQSAPPAKRPRKEGSPAKAEF